LLTTSSGKKMGKTEQGAVWIDQKKFNSFDFYQYWRNVDDKDVEKLLLIFSDLEHSEIKQIIKSDINGAKKRLAFLVTSDCHSEKDAKEAEEKAISIFEKSSFEDLDEITIKNDSDKKILEVLVANKLAPSKSEAKRLIEGGAIKIDDNPINDNNFELDSSCNDKILRIGKKKLFKLKIS